jgi:hypothetical protein
LVVPVAVVLAVQEELAPTSDVELEVEVVSAVELVVVALASTVIDPQSVALALVTVSFVASGVGGVRLATAEESVVLAGSGVGAVGATAVVLTTGGVSAAVVLVLELVFPATWSVAPPWFVDFGEVALVLPLPAFAAILFAISSSRHFNPLRRIQSWPSPLCRS